jgi:hypothetical protein
MDDARVPKAIRFPAGLAAAAGLLMLAGCFGAPDIGPTAGAVTDAKPGSPRAQAIAEIRAEAAAAAAVKRPYPDPYQSAQTTRLAARAEPLSVADVGAIKAELTRIAKRRAATTDAREIAALAARERDLRKLLLRSGKPEPLR